MVLKESFSVEADDVDKETRTCRTRDPSAVKTSYGRTEATIRAKFTMYFTDDTGGHPLSPSHWAKEG